MDSQREIGAGRWTPLFGVLSAVLAIGGVFAVGGSTPEAKDGPAKITHYYVAHQNKSVAAAYMVALAGVALLLFMPALRQRLSATQEGRSAWMPVLTASFAIVAGALMLAAGVHFSLAGDAKDLPPTAVAALNSVDGTSFIAVFAGMVGLLTSVVVLAWPTRALPRWLLVPAGLIAVVCVTPFGWFGAPLGMLWIAATGLYLALGQERPAMAAPTPAPAA